MTHERRPIKVATGQRLCAPPVMPLALFGLALTGTLYSGYLTYLELFVIRAICPWCASSAVLCALGGWDVAAASSERG